MHAKVRSQTRAFLVDCLKFLREKEPTIYGIDMDGLDHDTESESLAPTEGVLANVVAKLRATADQTYMSTRGWDDFYLTLTQIVEMGHVETAILLNHGFLEFCSRLFVMHTVKQVQEEYYDLSRIMIGKRTGIFNRLIGCLTALLARTDPRLPNIALSQNENRQTTLDRERLKFPLSRRERQILFLWDNDLKAIAVLDKVLENFDQTQVDHFYPGDIVKWMLGSPDVAVQANLFRSIAEGVALDPPFCDAYIQAALSYCEACPVAENVVKIITAISKAIATSNTLDEERAPGGDAILEYFTGLLNAENDELFKQRNPYIFHHYLMVKSRIYAVPLLMHTNESVRKGTHAFLTALYDNSEELPHETMLAKWKSVRGLIAEMTTRIAYEKDAGILRSHLSPLIATYQVLIQILYDLSRSEDAELEQYKDANDTALFYQYRTEVEPRLRAWPYEMDTPLSTVEHFDQSDYGSESDDGAQDLPDV
jgi:ubiquitin carboxyl-terminal hydrolase 34